MSKKVSTKAKRNNRVSQVDDNNALAYRILFIAIGVAGFLVLALTPIGKTFETTPSPFNAASRLLDQASISAADCLKLKAEKNDCVAELQRFATTKEAVVLSGNGSLFVERTQMSLIVDALAKVGSAVLLLFVLSKVATWATPERQSSVQREAPNDQK